MKPEVVSKLSQLEKFAVGVIEEKFRNLAKDCEYGYQETEGKLNCRHHSSGVGCCEPELCPRLKSDTG